MTTQTLTFRPAELADLDAVDAFAFARTGRAADVRGARLTTAVATAAAVCGAWAARRVD